MKCIPPFGCCCRRCCCAQRCRYRFQPTDQCADPSEYPKFKQIQNNIYKTKDLLMFLVDEFPKHRREERERPGFEAEDTTYVVPADLPALWLA